MCIMIKFSVKLCTVSITHSGTVPSLASNRYSSLLQTKGVCVLTKVLVCECAYVLCVCVCVLILMTISCLLVPASSNSVVLPYLATPHNIVQVVHTVHL